MNKPIICQVVKFLFLIAVFFSIKIITKGQGIKFETGLSWEEVRAKAKVEKKYIFMDCYATWCGPCKLMDRNIYPRKEVGDFFNAHFINVAIQMDQTVKDTQTVRAWYADAEAIRKKYSINAYPTYLFFNPDGIVVHRMVGSIQEAEQFIAKAKDAFIPSKQYYIILEQRKNHKGDSAALLHDLIAAIDAEDKNNIQNIANDYIDCLRNPLNIDNIKLISQVIYSQSDKGFQIILRNLFEIEEILHDKNLVEDKLSSIIFDEEVLPLFSEANAIIDWGEISANLKLKYPQSSGEQLIALCEKKMRGSLTRELRSKIYKQDGALIDWSEISTIFEKRYPSYDLKKIFLEQQAEYYSRKKMWVKCEMAAFSLLAQYEFQLNEREINNIAWDYVFIHSDKQIILLKALTCMKRVIRDRPDQFNNLDTYANLLYKIGQIKEAIEWENKAIDIAVRSNADLSDIEEIKSNLLKMKRGEKTWMD